jgi:hypothetical protein
MILLEIIPNTLYKMIFLSFFISIPLTMAAQLLMPQIPRDPAWASSGPASSTQISPTFTTAASWNPSSAFKATQIIFENTALPPASSVQARTYFDLQRRLAQTAPIKFMAKVSSINAGLFTPYISQSAYLRYLKLLELTYAAIKHFHRCAPQRALNILVSGAEDGFIALATSIFARPNDRITLLDSSRDALITARANIERDGKQFFLQRINLFPGNLSMLSGNFDVIVDLQVTMMSNERELRDKLAFKGLLVTQRQRAFHLHQLESDGRFSTLRTL